MNDIIIRLDCESIDTEYIYETVCPVCNKYILIGTMFKEDQIMYCPYCGGLIGGNGHINSPRVYEYHVKDYVDYNFDYVTDYVTVNSESLPILLSTYNGYTR